MLVETVMIVTIISIQYDWLARDQVFSFIYWCVVLEMTRTYKRMSPKLVLLLLLF